jgi:hypothetical protein
LNKLAYCFIAILLFSCNAISTKNWSNSYRWKNQKFDTIQYINLEYKPVIIYDVKPNEPVFLEKTNARADSLYEIRKILIKKFKKRNILFSNTEGLYISIDSLIFKEHNESTQAFSDLGSQEYIGPSEEDYFHFKIYGHIMNCMGENMEIEASIDHNTTPRESYTIPGWIVKDGINAKPSRMIENTINEFSFRAYEVIKLCKK